MITAADFRNIITALGEQALEDIEWSENLKPPVDADDFALEAIFVICNSGMKNTVARRIFEKCRDELYRGGNARNVFGHLGKATAINDIWNGRAALLERYNAALDKIEFCASLPWIGDITKYHLAKNFGADVAKPDVHLQRLADREVTTAQALCDRLAAATGYRAATVDVVLWRACANGVLNSRTGEFMGATWAGDQPAQGEFGL
ncbi:hypothetical protein FJ959_18135 [Mesorhizobium sp. B2-2-4]|uniref:hypothetical protein n=1 Tax=unclassified Mesorhizobium TaxID=325217 RepID=UPI0011268B3F|nr:MULTISPECIES: hypothetical protein [unclassified Mesorhizobium]TPM55328.1 hypothetical protein FJ959_18135 [Mesorhizobium sp. B2-2-4]TPM66295.1 hypothetical protein FJ965_14095 [Mesorhizobium sp. B2-2-1]TPN59924.1 hypothetical protein FJ984_30900 [Mesorhizobium sp. B1-1-3]